MIARGKPNRLNVLIAHFEGEGSLDIRDRIKEQLNKVFGGIADRLFEIINCPWTLKASRSGTDTKIQARVLRKGRRWLRHTRADLLIWGRAHRNVDRATIYFLLPDDANRANRNTETVEQGNSIARSYSTHSPPRSKIYEFDKSPEEFGADAAETIAIAALMCVRPIFAAETVQKLKPKYALERIHKLEPFVGHSVVGIPDNLRAEISSAYLSASQGLGRQGIMDGWQRTFWFLNEELRKTDKNSDRDGWADAALRLANALSEGGKQCGVNEWLEQAIAFNRELLDIKSRERRPLHWALTQNSLGVALQYLGEREGGTVRLKETVVAYHDALMEWTRERVPFEWAGTQCNLGVALQSLGERESGTTRLEEAVAAYHDALMEWTRERAPLEWAMTQHNLGTALRVLGERESGTARLEEAVAAFREALMEWTRDRKSTRLNSSHRR